MRRVLIVAVAAIAAIAPTPAWLVERWYSVGLYPPLQHALTSATNLVPFAAFDVLWIGASAWVAVAAYRTLRARDRWPAIRRFLTGAATAVAIVYLVFLCTWGLNYRRVPMIERVAFDPSRVTHESAAALGARTVAELNASYAAAHQHPPSLEDLAAAFASAQHAFGARTLIVPGRPKPTLLGAYFHQTSITGMTDPFLLETMLAPDLLEVERPFVIAHEWAHLAGFADESEANFVGWVACQRGDAAARYSAALMLIGYVEPLDRSVARRLDIGPRTDLYAIAERYAHANRVLQAAAREGYDTYLKANRVRAGVVSYDLVVRLVLGTPFDAAGDPVLRLPPPP